MSQPDVLETDSSLWCRLNDGSISITAHDWQPSYRIVLRMNGTDFQTEAAAVIPFSVLENFVTRHRARRHSLEGSKQASHMRKILGSNPSAATKVLEGGGTGT